MHVMKPTPFSHICLIYLITMACQIDCFAQTNKLKLTQIVSAVKNNIESRPTIELTKTDIDTTDRFVYSVTNASVQEDTPYWITVSDGSVSIVIKSNTGDIDQTFSITDTQLLSFKRSLFKANIRVEKNESVIGLCGASCIQLSLFKKLKNYFKYDTLDPDNNLTYDLSIGEIFWSLLPMSLEELLASAYSGNELDIDPFDVLK